MVLTLLKRLFGADPGPRHPVLLRVTAGGRPVETARLTVTWYPSGMRSEQRKRTAQGLCIVPWRADEKRVSIDVSTEDGTEHHSIHRSDRDDGGRVHEIRLD